MAYVTRTNYCTRGSATSTTNWGAYGGIGGTAALSNQTGTAVFGTTFNRVTWSAATTSPSGGLTYTEPSGLVANQAYAIQMWVRSSKAQTISLTAQFLNASSTVVNAAFGPNVSVAANTWTQVTVTGTSGTAVTQVKLTAQPPSGSPNWASGDTLDGDGVMIENGTTPSTYFDGSTAAVNNLAYQWTGTANASTSQEYYALPTILTVAKTDAPCPRTEVTIVGLGTGTTVFNVWRTSDGTRKAVRGARNRSGVDSDFVVDYEAPLNRSLTYDIEVISGAQITQPTYPATVTVASATWWIQDPLVPSSAIPLNVSKQDSNAPYLTGNAIRSLDYGASVTLIPILGSPDPVALMGNRTSAGNVTFDMFTNLATVTTQLRNLIMQTPLLLIRSTGTRNNGIPGLAYFTSAKPSEKPVTVAFGGTLTNWSLTGDLVAAPTMNALVPIWTYGNVAALWTTYQQAQTTLAAKTYLDVLKSPAGT